MSQFHVEETAVINAPAEKVYAILADYQVGHPAILPTRYFKGVRVTAGGRGAGTTAVVDMNVFGAKVRYNLVVGEPEPGRVLMEEDAEAGVSTTFTVDPIEGGRQARVTIATTSKTGPGLRGRLEKLFNPAIMRKVYREELQQLARVAQAAPNASVA